jgi:hypothetical protein
VRQPVSSNQQSLIPKDRREPIGEKFNQLDKQFNYSINAASDQIRLAKSNQIFGFSVCPITQKSFAVLLSDGRMLKYELFRKRKLRSTSDKCEEAVSRSVFLFDILSKEPAAKDLKITLVSLINAMPQMPYLIKMCPPLTKKNSKYWQPLLAIGCPSGHLYVYNLNQNRLVKKLQMFTHAVFGIEWCSTFMVITWTNNGLSSVADVSSTSNTSSQAGKQVLVRNEVLLTDLRTGKFNSKEVKVRENTKCNA